MADLPRPGRIPFAAATGSRCSSVSWCPTTPPSVAASPRLRPSDVGSTPRWRWTRTVKPRWSRRRAGRFLGARQALAQPWPLVHATLGSFRPHIAAGRSRRRNTWRKRATPTPSRRGCPRASSSPSATQRKSRKLQGGTSSPTTPPRLPWAASAPFGTGRSRTRRRPHRVASVGAAIAPIRDFGGSGRTTPATNPLYNPRYPRANAYDPEWVFENQMGPNALWLLESLTERAADRTRHARARPRLRQGDDVDLPRQRVRRRGVGHRPLDRAPRTTRTASAPPASRTSSCRSTPKRTSCRSRPSTST